MRWLIKLVKKMNRVISFMQRKNARKKDISAMRGMRNELHSLIKSIALADQLDSPVGLDSLYNDDPNSVESSMQDNGEPIIECQPTNQDSLESRVQALEQAVVGFKDSETARAEKINRLATKLDWQCRTVEGLVDKVKAQEEVKARNTRSIEE